MTLPFHPLANIFPLIEGAEFDDLVSSVKANGLRDPIIVHEGMVLDGRNRQRACETADIDCIYQPLPSDEDPLQFVIDKNLRRRQLNESQRAFVAAKLANLSEGRPSENSANLQSLETESEARHNEPPQVSQAQAAQMLNVSTRSVAAAKAVQQHCAPELQRAVERGKLSVSAAAEVAELPQEEQRELIERGEQEVVTRAKEIRTTKKKRTRGPSIVESEKQESQHDRDVRLLQGVWEAACESARADFLRGLGYEPIRGAA